MQMGLNGSTPASQSPATTPQQYQQMMYQQTQAAAQQNAQQRQASGPTRPHSMAFEPGTPMDPSSSGAGAGARDNTPPERKRQRRNSGSAAASPFVTPQTLQPGFQPGQQSQPLQQAGMAMQQQMQQMMPGMTNGPSSNSPANAPAQSPRNLALNGVPSSTHAMQRNQSKSGDGSMPPPQSPASGMGRTPGAQSSKLAMTPKTTKEGATPQSVRNSPQNATQPPEQARGLSPSPPTDPNASGSASAPATAAAAPTGANGTAETQLFSGEMLDSNLFGTDADLDWMTNLTAGPDGAFDFTTYLENIGEDNDGEVGVV